MSDKGETQKKPVCGEKISFTQQCTPAGEHDGVLEFSCTSSWERLQQCPGQADRVLEREERNWTKKRWTKGFIHGGGGTSTLREMHERAWEELADTTEYLVDKLESFRGRH